MPCDCPRILEQILSELAEIRALLQPKRCTPGDLEALQRILPAIAGLFGSDPVTVREILGDPAISVLSGSAGSTGGLLARAADDQAVIGGLQVQRIAKEHNKVLWRVVRTLPEPLEPR